MTRLVAFVALLAALFGGAVAVGRAVGPLERGAADGQAGHGDAERELSVELIRGPSLRYRIVDGDGRPVTSYDVLHARPMHLILVRRDLAHFQHLHPRRSSGNTWLVPLALPAAGTYTAFADFSTGGERQTLEFDLNAATVHGEFTPEPRPQARRVVTDGRYRVALRGNIQAGQLEFGVTRDGRSVRVARYLGARGHLVALRERDLEYLHVHAEEDELAFDAEFPSAGWYRLFLQFKADGAVRTAEFALEVKP